MRHSRPILLAALAATLAVAAPAGANVPHTVQPGETLWSIAASNNFTTRSLAAANRLPETAQLQSGSTIQIPSEQEAAAALGTTGAGTTGAGTTGAGTTGAGTTGSGTNAPPPLGGYTVLPGDTLSTIASNSGISVEQLAWMNGLDLSAVLPAGTALKLPTDAPLAAHEQATPAAPEVLPDAEPNATAGHVTSTEIGGIAANHGVSPSLAAAVAWQESGFNNGVISSANARGVMQILPGTWTWVQDQLAAGPLDPNSPLDNVNAGVMYLDQLLADAGGDEARAVASYYQGAASVQETGLLPETERYVENVMALRSRFGGP